MFGGVGGVLVFLTLALLLTAGVVCLHNKKKTLSLSIITKGSESNLTTTSSLSSPSNSSDLNSTHYQVNYVVDPIMMGSSSNIEMQEYCMEPRRPGSVPPGGEGDEHYAGEYVQHTTFR